MLSISATVRDRITSSVIKIPEREYDPLWLAYFKQIYRTEKMIRIHSSQQSVQNTEVKTSKVFSILNATK